MLLMYVGVGGRLYILQSTVVRSFSEAVSLLTSILVKLNFWLHADSAAAEIYREKALFSLWNSCTRPISFLPFQKKLSDGKDTLRNGNCYMRSLAKEPQ